MKNSRNLMRFGYRCVRILALFTSVALSASVVHADVVTDWIKVMNDTVLAGNSNPLVTSRVVAMFSASVFDAVNGIHGRYTSIHETAKGPRGASRRAAAIQAAYAVLVANYPAQKSALDAQRLTSLNTIGASDGDEDDASIDLGIQWGQTVADDIMTWRSTDGFTPPPPPYLGGTAIGQWRPTPPDFSPGAGPQFATMTTWVINSPNQFRPGGPPDLTSAEYAAVFNETKTMGRSTGSLRTADQTQLAVFWNGNTALYWNRIAWSLATKRHSSLLENARMFALMNVAMADAAIACWDGKYHYQFWRPITAITLADKDGNAATDVDLTWTPLLVITPSHPEYPSGHSTVSASAAAVLTSFYGDRTSFSVDSNVLPGVVRSFASFSDAIAEVNNARVFGGIHFRTACLDGNKLGRKVARFVLRNAAEPRDENHNRGEGGDRD